MVKRVIIKTVLICFGVFLILSTILSAYIFNKYPLDMEKRISVVIAATDIREGAVIGEKDIEIKEIPLSVANESMVLSTKQVIGRKSGIQMQRYDYVRIQDLISRENWYKEDERIIILPVNIEERLANLIKKGSYIDIGLKKEIGNSVEIILTKVKVEDVLDEMGTSLNSKAGKNSRIAYMKFIMNENERQKVYKARSTGKLIYELYCDDNQDLSK